MTQRRKSSGELALAAEPANGAKTAGEGTPAQVMPNGSSGTESTAHGASEYEGRVAGVERDRIVGWAWDAAKPYEPVDVELYIGELRVGHGSADRFDIELAKLKRGNGMHRFELGLDRLPGSSPPFVVRAVIVGSEKELLPAITLATIEDAELLLSGTEYMGKITGIEEGKLCGWVLNWHNPHEEPVVTLRDGDISVLTRRVSEPTNAVINTGVTANAFRFELPVPANVLDGRPHLLSVTAGASGRELEGSPIIFGPADVASLGQSLAAAFDRQQQLERKVASLEPTRDDRFLEKRITDNILDRVDMLLNIHRDALERELAVLRRQVTELLRVSPQGEPDVILPLAKAPAIEDETPQAPETFTVMARSAPLISYDLAAKPGSVKPSEGLIWSRSAASPGVSITDGGNIALDGVPGGPASLILHGSGARNHLEFCGIVTAFHGRTLTGRVEVAESGNWTLIGTTVGTTPQVAGAQGLSVAYLTDLSKPSGMLSLGHISVYHRGRVPEWVDTAPPQSTILYVGADAGHNGWYPLEPGPRGGLCWMGAQAEATLRVRQSGLYRLSIPQLHPLVPEIVSKLQISLGGVPVKVQFSPSRGDTTIFQVNGEVRIPPDQGETLVLRLSFPADCVRTPVELGLNADQRPLTIAIRAIALSALEA